MARDAIEKMRTYLGQLIRESDRLTDTEELQPPDSLLAFGNQREANSSTNNAVCSRNGELKEGGGQLPHSRT